MNIVKNRNSYFILIVISFNSIRNFTVVNRIFGAISIIIVIIIMIISTVYKMGGRSVSVYTDTSASREYLCTLMQNGHKFCKLLTNRPQTVMFSNCV